MTHTNTSSVADCCCQDYLPRYALQLHLSQCMMEMKTG